MKSLVFILITLFILSSCNDEKSAADKNFAIINGINLSNVSMEKILKQREFNQKILTCLPTKFVERIGTRCVENLHLISAMQITKSWPLPGCTIQVAFNGNREKYTFCEGEVLYRGFNGEHELFGMLVDSITKNFYNAIIRAQCSYIRENTDKIPFTED